MGQAMMRKRQRTYKPTSRDRPYYIAISDLSYLDWKVHYMPHVKNGKERDDLLMEQNMKHNNLPVAILDDFLYISSRGGVSNMQRLQELGITHILNVGGSEASPLPLETYQDEGIKYMVMEAEDDANYPMLKRHWEDAREFIDGAHQASGKVVVHCMAGVNRSATIVAAYYMVHTQTNVLETVKHCRTRRGNLFLCSNNNFQQQLVALARYEGLLGPRPGEPTCVVKDTVAS